MIVVFFIPILAILTTWIVSLNYVIENLRLRPRMKKNDKIDVFFLILGTDLSKIQCLESRWTCREICIYETKNAILLNLFNKGRHSSLVD